MLTLRLHYVTADLHNFVVSHDDFPLNFVEFQDDFVVCRRPFATWNAPSAHLLSGSGATPLPLAHLYSHIIYLNLPKTHNLCVFIVLSTSILSFFYFIITIL